MLMKCLSVAPRISGISRLLYVGQQGQKFDSLARKQSTNGFLKCKEESRTMLDRWVSIKLTVEELIHVISAETQAPVVEKVDSG